ncbi:protein phosphatase 2C [Magnaporthiopsis poae ATCC 64411]|uniref:Protein phosphatase 2C n=1 Tax=Magnaporthiopsis poae (strain ATCC 64411 / 73-15) TaxID=644358 RepID=A0A0C4E6A5_MAGP6|nr:protein phosphatase 2C [Magnaporthiopsis poae ATCC 64411]
MFGGGSASSKADGSTATNTPGGTGATDAAAKTSPSSVSPGGASANKSPPPEDADATSGGTSPPNSGEKRSGNGSPPAAVGTADQKKRRSSGVSSKASSLLASAKSTLNFAQGAARASSGANAASQTPLQKLGKQDPALAVPQGQHNNSAGESLPGPRSTFRVGVWEDRNKKCRRTMEDTHAFLYNFLHTPLATTSGGDCGANSPAIGAPGQEAAETDNGYFAIFDGHAGTFAADWCGKKLHLILEETIRKNPNVPIPELLDQTFTTVDTQLEKLPVKNSGCTAAIAVLRWEDRVPSSQSATGSQPVGAAKAFEDTPKPEDVRGGEVTGPRAPDVRAKAPVSRQRVLYTANVGDARIILCRSGKALRLSYDHKGSDENEGKRITNAGGLILNNRVNGVLAVTRALGDTYMKDLVTGHPYTTETVIQPDLDEFIIIACDGLWDVCDDQEAVDQVRHIQDPAAASKLLVNHALARFSTDNLSCMIVRFDKHALGDGHTGNESLDIAESDAGGKPSEADRIVNAAKQKIAESGVPAVGVSPSSNAPRGHDAIPSISEEPLVIAEHSDTPPSEPRPGESSKDGRA